MVHNKGSLWLVTIKSWLIMVDPYLVVHGRALGCESSTHQLVQLLGSRRGVAMVPLKHEL